MSEIGGPEDLPAGEYAIVELFGHQTMVGRITEVERFGAKMMALESLYCDQLLPAVFHGGAAIYRLTPCSATVAWERRPKRSYQIPPSLAATLPQALLANAESEAFDDDNRV
jgi:hypothetical protein